MSNTSSSQTLSPNDCWKNRYGTVLCHVKANLEGQTPKYTIYMYCHCDSYISSYNKRAQQKCVSYLWQHKNAHSHGSVHVNTNPEKTHSQTYNIPSLTHIYIKSLVTTSELDKKCYVSLATQIIAHLSIEARVWVQLPALTNGMVMWSHF